MSSQKKLKARIRERMQQTGESYTTARRAVLDEAMDRAALRPLLAGELQVSQQTSVLSISHATARSLERRGLARIDERTHRVSITDEGRALFAEEELDAP